MIPVYLINGFLDGGKTTFISYTISQPYFQMKDKTLIICCEQGDEEYADELLRASNSVLEVIEEEEQFSASYLIELEKKHKPGRIILEWNGMWNVKKMKMPWHWKVEQQVTCLCGTTFSIYFSNMKSQLAEMLRKSELIILNRCDNLPNLPNYKRNLKAINQKAEIIFEDSAGEMSVVMDEDLPYDLKSDLLSLNDEQYGIWYIDALENTDRYLDKTIEFVATVFTPKNFPEGYFVPGRMAMTCCADDMAFIGFACKYEGAEKLEQKSWLKIRAVVKREFLDVYGEEGPVLHAVSLEKIEKPKEEIISFV